MIQHEIIIVGGGVVGAALAVALAREHYDVALVERSDAQPVFNPGNYDLRVYAIAPGSRRFFEHLGLWDAIAAARISPFEGMRIWHRHPDQALEFDAAETGVAELGWIIENEVLLAALWSALDGVAVYRGAAVEDYVVGTAGDEAGLARLSLRDGREFAARLIVAADGAESRLRELAGIPITGWDYAQKAIVCHVETERPHRRIALQRFTASGPLAFLPLADGRSSIVWSTTDADKLRSLSDAEFRAELTRASHEQLGAITGNTPRLAFPLRLLHAHDYVRGPLVLIGDAAHVIHPLAGQGVNLGLADAILLAEILAEAKAAGHPPAAERALKRYQRARKAENLEMLALTDALHRAFGLSAPLWSGALELGMHAFSGLTPIKTWLARRAMGLGESSARRL